MSGRAPPGAYRLLSLSGRLTLAIVGTLSLALLAVAGLLSFNEASGARSDRIGAIETATRSLAGTLAENIWNFEMERANGLVLSAAGAPHIVRVEVIDATGDVLFDEGDMSDAGEMLTEQAPIIFKDAFVEKEIGRVKVTARRPDFFELFVAHLEEYALILGVATAAAAIATRAIVVQIVDKPILALSHAIGETRKDGVPRRVSYSTSSELAKLISDYNALADTLAASQKEAAERLDEVVRANESKTRFLAMMSHELRTPLNGVLGMAQLLIAQSKTQRTADYALTILNSGKALLRLVDDVLDVARAETGAIELRPAPTNLKELIDEAAKASADAAEAKGLALTIENSLPAEEERMVDGHRLSQIIANLLENAVKFTKHGGVRLSVHPLSGDGLRFEVADTGDGVPEELRDRIFERFRQADEAVSRAFGGAGLGLAICRDLIQQMSGRIDVADAPDGGALFWFEIAPPQTEASEAEESAPAATPIVTTASLKAGGAKGHTTH